jgi:AraC-like DNA-binding protein
MQRTHDIDVKIEEGRFIADRIQGAKFVEFDGKDHLFWVGNTSEVLAEMKAFITKVEPAPNYEERLFTIVSSRIISTYPTTSIHQEIINRLVVRYRGKIVQYNQVAFTAIFEGPSKAVHCSIEVIAAMQSLKVMVSVGIHIKESVVDEAFFITQQTRDFIESILKPAQPNQILITQPVKFLLSGAGLSFAHHTSITEPTTGESLSLFQVTDHLDAQEDLAKNYLERLFPQNDSFLENVLQIIDKHLNDESFGVEMLCREIGTSERQAQRKLKAITNKSPNQLISSVRLHRAKELLLNNQFNISEIAFQTGFSDPSYFSKNFKKEFGLSPSELLQEAR